MAVTWQTPSAVAYSAQNGSSVTVAYPAGSAEGNKLILIIGMKPSAANSGSVTTPAGWTPIVSITGAGGYGTTIGADTGNCNLFAFERNVPAGGLSGSLAITVSTNNVCWGLMCRLTNSGGSWDIAGTTGSDTTAGNVSIDFASDPGVKTGDILIGAMCIPTDVTTPSQFSAEAFTQSGITYSPATEVTESDSSTGNDIGGFLCYATVTGGTSRGIPTLTATAGGTTTNVRGPGLYIRIREGATTHTAGLLEPSATGESTNASLILAFSCPEEVAPTGESISGSLVAQTSASEAHNSSESEIAAQGQPANLSEPEAGAESFSISVALPVTYTEPTITTGLIAGTISIQIIHGESELSATDNQVTAKQTSVSHEDAGITSGDGQSAAQSQSSFSADPIFSKEAPFVNLTAHVFYSDIGISGTDTPFPLTQFPIDHSEADLLSAALQGISLDRSVFREEDGISAVDSHGATRGKSENIEEPTNSGGNQTVDLTILISHAEVGLAGMESQSSLVRANIGHSEPIVSGLMDLGSLEINLTNVELLTASCESETISLIFKVSKSEPLIAEAGGDGIPLERLILSDELSLLDTPTAKSVVTGSREEILSSTEILSASTQLLAAIMESAYSNEAGFGAYFLSILADIASKESSDVILTLRLDSIPAWIIQTIAAPIKPSNAITVEVNL